MKIILPIILFWACLCFIGCSSSKYILSRVNVLSEGNGTITVRSVGEGNNKKEAILKAEENAVAILLFRGIPNSQQNTPVVSIDESTARSRYKKYFDELFTQGRYRTFIISSIAMGDFGKYGRKERNIPIDVEINLKALKNDLETQGIIRKFGY